MDICLQEEMIELQNDTAMKIRFSQMVECYGRGTVHKDICSNLNIKHAAEANIPCILFVYKVSREIEDLRNALRWITDNKGTCKDICVVILLEKTSKGKKEMEKSTVIECNIFNEETKVYRIFWNNANFSSISEISTPIKTAINQRNEGGQDKPQLSDSMTRVPENQEQNQYQGGQDYLQICSVASDQKQSTCQIS